MKPIGILGGGQLALMLSQAAHRLGFETIIFDPDPDACAASEADQHFACSYTDKQALKNFADACSICTYEFENISKDCLVYLLGYGVRIPQGLKALQVSQNRQAEKLFFQELALKEPSLEINPVPFILLDPDEPLNENLNQYLPGILKSLTGGYDGKNQSNIQDRTALEPITQKTLLEKKIKLQAEFSMIALGQQTGETLFFPVIENTHSAGILQLSQTPSKHTTPQIESKLRSFARLAVQELGYIGVIAFEFFLSTSGEIFINEMAPRPHNSGHLTIEACGVSQFEGHLRAISGMTITETDLELIVSKACMHNLLGLDYKLQALRLSTGDFHFYDYGKKEARAGRKMGHLTKIEL